MNFIAVILTVVVLVAAAILALAFIGNGAAQQAINCAANIGQSVLDGVGTGSHSPGQCR